MSDRSGTTLCMRLTTMFTFETDLENPVKRLIIRFKLESTIYLIDHSIRTLRPSPAKRAAVSLQLVDHPDILLFVIFGFVYLIGRARCRCPPP